MGLVVDDITDDGEVLVIVTERFERRLSEECGQLRVELASELGSLRSEMSTGVGKIRVEMVERNAELLKWALVFGITQTVAIASIVSLIP